MLEFHPLANIFPLIEGAEFDALLNDVKENGLREKIVLLDGMILDGRNRYRACMYSGVKPSFHAYGNSDSYNTDFETTTDKYGSETTVTEFTVSDDEYEIFDAEYHGDLENPVSFVVSLNLRRRHLSESQRAIVAAKLANMVVGGKEANASIEAIAVSQNDAAEMLNVSRSGVQRARAVMNEGVPELVDAVAAGQVAVSAALEVSALPEDEQREIVSQGPDAVKEVAAELRNYRTQFTGNNEWYTPTKYLELARQLFGGKIDVDPASNPYAQEIVQAGVYYDKETDGLKQEWRGNVWLNPPYSQPEIVHFTDKLVSEVEAGIAKSAILLTHNSTDTAWFQKVARKATAICFTKGRIKFYSPENQLAAPTMGQSFCYFGDDIKGFTELFSEVGFVVEVISK